MVDSKTFQWADYLILSATLVIGIGIGIYHGYAGRKKKTVNDILMGGRNMGVIPIALSMHATFMSAITLLGGTAEVYGFGTMIFMKIFCEIFIIPFFTIVFIPFVRRGHSSINAYEYFEKRFNRTVRYTTSAIFAFSTIIYIAVVQYAPALAFNQVTGLPMWLSVIATGAVCTFYTALGGMKAVVWTDVFQMVIFTGGLLFLMIKGVISCGGLSNVFHVANAGSRLEFLRHDFSLFTRHTIWTQVIGSSFTVAAVLSSQSILQRMLSLKTTREAQWANIMSRISNIVTSLIIAFLGLIIYAYYSTCDPLTTKKIILLYMMEVLGATQGLPGLFTSSVFAAALSSVSSGVNSMAAVVLEDFVKPLYAFVNCKAMHDSMGVTVTKLLTLAIGILCIGLAYGVGTFGRTVIQIAYSIIGATQAPIFALFIIGMFLPFVNSWGALAGLLSSITITCSLSFGALKYALPPQTLTLDTSGCSPINKTDPNASKNMTLFYGTLGVTSPLISTANTTQLNDTSDNNMVSQSSLSVFDISYVWYAVIAFIVSVTVASAVSVLTGCNRKKPVDSNLLYYGQRLSSRGTAANNKHTNANADADAEDEMIFRDKETCRAYESEMKL